MGKTAKIRAAAENFHEKWPMKVSGYSCKYESRMELIGTGQIPVGLALFKGWRRGDASCRYIFSLTPRFPTQPTAMEPLPHDPGWLPPSTVQKRPSVDVVDMLEEALDTAKEAMSDSTAGTPYPDASRVIWTDKYSTTPMTMGDGRCLYNFAKLMVMGTGYLVYLANEQGEFDIGEDAPIKIRAARASGAKNKGFEGSRDGQLCFQMRRAKVEAGIIGRDPSEGKIDAWSIEVAPGIDPCLSLAITLLLEKHKLWENYEHISGSSLMEEVQNGNMDCALVENPLPGEFAQEE